MSETTDTSLMQHVVDTFEKQAVVNDTVIEALDTIAARLAILEARIGKIARNLPKS